MHDRSTVHSWQRTRRDDRVVPLHSTTCPGIEQVPGRDTAEHGARLRLRAGRVSVRGRSGGARHAQAGERALTTAITLTTSETDLVRLRSEFQLFPGMCLTVEQAARLLDVSRDEAAGLFEALEFEGLVVHGRRGDYRRMSPLLS